MTTLLIIGGTLAGVALAGLVFEKVRRNRGLFISSGDDTMLRYYRDVHDSHDGGG